MAFDVLATSTHEAADAGVFMPFTNPIDGAPFTDGDKQIGVTLRSRFSTAAQALDRRYAERALAEQSQRNSKVVTASQRLDDAYDRDTELLAVCTAGWTFDTLNGEPFPFSLENAKKLWADPRLQPHRLRAQVFMNNEANFTKR